MIYSDPAIINYANPSLFKKGAAVSSHRFLIVLTFLATLALPLVAAGADDTTGSRHLDNLGNELRALTAQVSPAVVQIYTSSFGQLTPQAPQGSAVFGQQQATGSGVILSEDGYIVTNNHVVNGAKRVLVRLSPETMGVPQGQSILSTGGDLVGAQVIGVDHEADLAVLKINKTGLPFLELTTSDDLFQGQMVFAVGSPLGLANSVSFGVVSTVARQLERDAPMVYIQTDVAVNPGNSGGPLINTEGKVVGINTLIMSQSGGSEGLSFSVPSNIVKAVYDRIRTFGRVRRGVIHVLPQTLNPLIAKPLGYEEQWGVILGDVHPEGSADKAGLKIGDIVLSLDGKKMENARQFIVDVYLREIGSKVKVEVKRGSQTLTKEVEVFERHEPNYHFFDRITTERNLISRLGVLGLDLDKEAEQMLGTSPRRHEGVIVAALAANVSLLGEAFLPGDIIYALNGQPVKGMRSLKNLVRDLDYGSGNVVQVERGGQLRYLIMIVE